MWLKKPFSSSRSYTRFPNKYPAREGDFMWFSFFPGVKTRGYNNIAPMEH
ncbi:MAG: hypothetical protein ACJAWX_001318 [Algoriphagus sp.]|jgi:hypothetical protein